MFYAQQLPPNVYWYDAVQVVLLIICIGAIVYIGNRVFDHGGRLIKLETEKTSDTTTHDELKEQLKELRKDFSSLERTVTNHYSHRFEQVAQALGIEWKDEG